jgi:hypothetical protein
MGNMTKEAFAKINQSMHKLRDKVHRSESHSKDEYAKTAEKSALATPKPESKETQPLEMEQVTRKPAALRKKKAVSKKAKTPRAKLAMKGKKKTASLKRSKKKSKTLSKRK